MIVVSFCAERLVSAAERRALIHSSKVNRSARRLRKSYRKLEGARLDSEALAEQWKTQFERMQRRISQTAESAMEDMENAERLQSQYEETVDGLRSELTVLRETTIPSLVSSNKLVLSELDAWTAIQVRRQVSAMPGISVE